MVNKKFLNIYKHFNVISTHKKILADVRGIYELMEKYGPNPQEYEGLAGEDLADAFNRQNEMLKIKFVEEDDDM